MTGKARWPAAIWDAAVMRSLDERGQREIEAAGALRDVASGDLLFRMGDAADAFFVVESGEIVLYAARRGEADASAIRRARAGETFGEEASLRTGTTRRTEALCVAKGRVAEVPVHVFRRAAERAGASEIAQRNERALRRAATLDLLCTTSFTRELPEADIERLLDAIEHVHLARGEALFRAGDRATHVYFVADGMLQVQTEDDDRLHVRAYVSRGDVLGEGSVASGRLPILATEARPIRRVDEAPTRNVSAVASGSAWVLAAPRDLFLAIARRNPGLLEGIERVATLARAAQESIVASANTTQHVLKDLYRLEVARSLLVIDQDTCVRCGHCAWSCANVHEDGVSRLVRRGDKVITRVEPATASHAAPNRTESLLIPNSCQHCENPACMIDCPTGAIGRDPRGEVFIREALCIGCGNCAKGCPWDNIQMAPRGGSSLFAALLAKPRASSVDAKLSIDVAVKCDLCHGVDGGPACVASCPVEAIVRMNPTDVLPEVARALGQEHGRAGTSAARPGRPRSPIFAKKAPAWPWMVGATLIAIALASVGGTRGGMAAGVLAAALVAFLAAYAVVKRAPRRVGVSAFTATRARVLMLAHIGIGIVVMGAVVMHAGLRVPSNLAGALVLAFWGTALAGVFGACVYRAIPSRLARIERGGALPEDLPARARELDERAFRCLTGKSELVKTIYARILRPYVRAPWGPLVLVGTGVSLHEEQERIGAFIARALGGQKSANLAGLDELVRIAVERRAVVAQRVLTSALRLWMPAHVVLSVVVLVLLVMHAFFALAYR